MKELTLIRPRQAPGCRCEVFDDELVIYQPGSERVHHLNDAAALIWQLCDGGRTSEEITQVLGDAFPDAAEQIPASVRRALSEMIGSGLLVL